MSINKTAEASSEKRDAPIFTTEAYRKKSQTNNTHLHGIDNIAVKIEDEM